MNDVISAVFTAYGALLDDFAQRLGVQRNPGETDALLRARFFACYSIPKACDCGAMKANTTHAGWCSTVHT